MTFSSEDLNYLTALGPASLGEGPIAHVQQAWQACLSGSSATQPAGVRQVIWDSWRRSVIAGIDPLDDAYRFVSPEVLAVRLTLNRVLIACAA